MNRETRRTIRTVGSLLQVLGGFAASPVDEVIVSAASGGSAIPIVPLQFSAGLAGGLGMVIVGTLLKTAVKED